jgi:hypothetical protein
LSVLLLAAVPAPAQDSGASHALAVHAGWWSVEAEYRAPFGLFVDVGIPWFASVLDSTTSGMEWDGAVGGMLGYDYPLSESWSIRGGLRVAFSFSHGCSCLDCPEEHNTKSYGFLEAGFLYRHSSGFIAGLTLPLYACDDLHELLQGQAEGVESFIFPVSLAFTQAYAGYAWVF